MPVAIDDADIQGDILRAYGNRFDRTSYVFVGVGEPKHGQAWLRGLVETVTTAVAWNGNEPESTLNVAFTHAGLIALGVGPETAGSFSSGATMDSSDSFTRGNSWPRSSSRRRPP